MFFDLLPYVALLFMTVVIPKLFEKKAYMHLLFLIFFVFCGFRYGIGWDYFNYCETLELGGWRIEKSEFLIRQLEYFCEKFGFVQFFFVATSFFTILFFFLMISKESENPGVSVFVYLTMAMFFFHSMTTIRFTLAVAIGFFACYFGYKKQYLPYFAFLFLSLLTHKAAVFGVLTIPFVLTRMKFGFAMNMTIFLVSFVLGTIIGSFSIISGLFNNLINSNEFLYELLSDAESYMVEENTTGFSRTPYIFATINLINLLSCRQFATTDDSGRFEHYVTMFNIGCSLTFLFSFQGTFASRLSQFFMCFILLIVPFYKKNSVQQILLYSIFLFVFFYQLTIKTYHPDFIGRINCWLPYRMNLSFY